MDKCAFIHISRTGGSTIHSHLVTWLPLMGYRVFNSWELWERDYTPEELIDISLFNDNAYVHNHVEGWSEVLLDHFQSLGWQFFTFVRPLDDLLCSYYFFHKNRSKEFATDITSLNDWIADAANDGGWGTCYSIPEYWRKIDQIWHFGAENISMFCQTNFGVLVEDYKVNCSSSEGYAFYKQAGVITCRTDMLIRQSVGFSRYYDVRAVTKGSHPSGTHFLLKHHL